MSKEFIIISWGGIGDALVCTPTYRALKEACPDHKIIVYYQNKGHEAVFRNNPHIDSLRALKIRSLLRYPSHLYAYLFNRKKVKYTLMHFQHIPLTWAFNKSVKDIVPEIFDLKLKDNTIQMFFSRGEEEIARLRLSQYRNVVLMHIHSRSSPNHHWAMENWNELVRKMPDYTFIQIGHTNEPSVEGAIDWRGKTGLREVMCLLKYADSFVGVDSFLSHATNAFNTPGVVLFGDSSPVYWGHDNNINIYKNVICSPCYYHLWGSPCPYGHECMKNITVGEVQEALVRQVNGKKRVNMQNQIAEG